MRKFLATCMILLCGATVFAGEPTRAPRDGYPRFALGADVSWTPYIEENNTYIYYRDDKEYVAPSRGPLSDFVTTVPEMVSDHGIDAVRLRVWVNPKSEKAVAGFSFKLDGVSYDEMSTYGTCSVEEMTTLARRFAMQGQRLMVVFQMSDTWADPAHQFIPEAWSGSTTIDELSVYAAAHVTEVLQILRDNNVNVAWVQIGNEVNNGMLEWPIPAEGATVTVAPFGCQVAESPAGDPTSTTYNFVKVFNDCSRVAKEIYPETKTVVHLTHGASWEWLNWSLNLLSKAGLSHNFCDYIGISLYPGDDNGREDYTGEWKSSADGCIETIDNIYQTYGFRTLLCEIGMNNEYSLSTPQAEIDRLGLQAAGIDQCNTDVRDFTEYLITQLGCDDSTCDGLFYWEPETDYLKNYKKGACVSANPGPSWPRDKLVANDWWYVIGQHSSFPEGGLIDYTIAGVEATLSDMTAEPQYYDLFGRIVANPSSGIYIERRGTTVVKVAK